MASAAVITVTPPESIQAAVDAAAPGDVVKVNPGDYIETHGGPAAVRITKTLKLIAKSKPTAKVRILPDPNNPSQTDGIVVEPANPGDPDVDGILIKGFTVEGFQNNGIWLKHTRNFKIKNNETINNLENGIWPTLSANGLVKKNVSYGSLDSALWVEASENVRVIRNELYNAPTGLEVTISKNVFMKANNVHDNTVGVGFYHSAAAGMPSTGLEGNWQLIGNTIVNNNFPNPVSGGLVGDLIPGIGILLIGPDDNLIQKNTVTGNDFLGLAIIDWCLVQDCVSNPPEDPDSVPERNRIVKNTITGNGGNPPGPPFGGLAGDVTSLAANNCFTGNTIGTSIPGTLPAECT
ncbi:MAG TPA: right-handed parallel beta-helix repeat-containing protein [Candidatus Limnocylindria bacterium]|nr:right-handed parallel beta-helix repeat-containing protein [Candidatus Limnocylindria bacterium]